MKRISDHHLRIIGGKWRSRHLPFPEQAGLRPTPNRIRETLFNWLTPVLSGARCLDLFAGSGALGVEALSRGAAHVTFIEREWRAVQMLQENLARLGADNARVDCGEALHWLQQSPTPFEIVFLDPPFGQALLTPLCNALEAHGWLADTAWIYLESEINAPELLLPVHWSWHREKTTGAVAYRLARRAR